MQKNETKNFGVFFFSLFISFLGKRRRTRRRRRRRRRQKQDRTKKPCLASPCSSSWWYSLLSRRVSLEVVCVEQRKGAERVSLRRVVGFFAKDDNNPKTQTTRVPEKKSKNKKIEKSKNQKCSLSRAARRWHPHGPALRCWRRPRLPSRTAVSRH